MSTDPVSAGQTTTTAQTAQPPEQVSLKSLSFLQSRIFRVAAAVVAGLAGKWIVPLIAGKDCSKGTIATVVLLWMAGLALYVKARKKELAFEISLLYTIWGSKAWWTPVTKNIVLGALPFEHQQAKIKALGVTHIVTALEHFELQNGLAKPAGKWNAIAIEHKHVETPDFEGMAADKIHEAVEYMRAEIQKSPQAKIYVHCKAGRGRSATIVVAYLWKYGADGRSFESVDAARDFVKKARPQINLNPQQMQAIHTYAQKHPRS
jgi:atypical dual specificity phosphatase